MKLNQQTLNEIYLMSLPERLKFFRLSSNISQTQLSKLTGVSESSIQKYELGIRTPKIQTLEKFANSLEIPLNLFYNTGLYENEVEKFQNIMDRERMFFSYLNSLGYTINQFSLRPKPTELKLYYKIVGGSHTFNIESIDMSELQNKLDEYISDFFKNHNI